MYSDNTLTPKETVRLCALGTLADEPMNYANLAGSIRHFIDRVQGPSLDVMGASVELLKYEGLINYDRNSQNDELLSLTTKGLIELKSLLIADIKPNDSSLNKLIEALKFRFMHLLSVNEKLEQTELLIDRLEIELTRLSDLRNYHKNDKGFLLKWLDRDIAQIKDRLVWLDGINYSL